jgi:hypothetical protein
MLGGWVKGNYRNRFNKPDGKNSSLWDAILSLNPTLAGVQFLGSTTMRQGVEPSERSAEHKEEAAQIGQPRWFSSKGAVARRSSL